jgi:hypothetical protein
MKASMDVSVVGGVVSYDLRKDAFDKMQRQNRNGPPMVLLVFAIPRQPADWLDVDDDRTLIKRCGWWIKADDIQWTAGNTRSCAVKIPQVQRFDPNALRGPLLKLSRMPHGVAS